MMEIRYKDIDPDTGEITNDQLVCQCPNPSITERILSLLIEDNDEPNRDFYIK